MSAHHYVPEGSAPPTVPVASVLGRMSRELRTLAGMTGQVQDLISRLVVVAAATDASSLRGLQRLDHIAQSIHGIASFLDMLAVTAPANCQLDALAASRAVSISDLAERLSLSDLPRPMGHHESSGDCQFFDAQD
jgi:hypothetical protein